MIIYLGNDVTFSESSVFGPVNYMTPLDVRQYLYCLTPKPEMCANPKLLKGVTNIGKLDIVWKTNIGEKGRLQTSQLQRVVSKSQLYSYIYGLMMVLNCFEICFEINVN